MSVLRGSGLVVGVALLAMTTSASAEEERESRWENWDVTLGLGAQYEPVSPGIDEYEVDPIPYVDIVYQDRFFLKSEKGLGAYVFKSDDDPEFALGLALGYEGGRDEEDAPTQLQGLGDLDSTFEAKIFAEGEVGPVELELELMQGLGGHKGFRAEFGAGVDAPIGDRFMIGAGPFITYADSQYMESYYGITTAQANRSTTYANTYDAGAGFESVGFEVNGMFKVTDHWSILGFAEYTQLLGDAADSPIVDQEGFFGVGLAAAYRF